MKNIVLTLMFLFSLVSLAYADANSEDNDHWEKVRQLDKLAERFKAETGFTGEINPNGALSHLAGFRGKFNDIPFSASADTTTFRQACDRIIDKLLPYTLATRKQLSKGRILKSSSKFETEYYQSVNGYRVESGGLILIIYDVGRYRFSISNGTVELPDEDTSRIITPSEAEQIALRDKNDEHYNISRVYDLFYSKEGSDSYYLAYRVGVSGVIDERFVQDDYWIDALTGFVKKACPTPKWESDIAVSVKGNYYWNTFDWNNINTQYDTLGIPDARVWIGNTSAQTDNVGNTILMNVLFSDQKVRLSNSHYWMTVKTNPDTLETNGFILDQNIPDLYHVHFPDSSNQVTHYSPNSYIEAMSHIEFLERYQPDYFGNSIKIATACSMNNAGAYYPGAERIDLKDARVHSIVRHELSHHFIYRVIGNMMGNTYQAAMDEGFANYFGGASKWDPYIPEIGGSYNLSSTLCVPDSSTTNEDSYCAYNRGIPIASAWWSLRNNQYFPPDGQKNGVDTLLVAGLDVVRAGIIEHTNDSYRYKPRYFYNIMMSRVDTDGVSWPFNDKQEAINAAYNSRGFHFYPEVQSVVSAANIYDKNFYSLSDSVYVNITNCPQNTVIQVRIVPDSAYTQVETAGIALSHFPAALDISGTYPVQTDTLRTNDSGIWSGGIPYSDQLAPGDYDIIVDVGSPDQPDGMLHLVFAQDNVIDGVDGLDGPGFVKTDWGNAAVALDLSSSMEDYGTHLTQSVQALAASMLPSEKVNVFGFTEGTASQAWENGAVDITHCE